MTPACMLFSLNTATVPSSLRSKSSRTLTSSQCATFPPSSQFLASRPFPRSVLSSQTPAPAPSVSPRIVRIAAHSLPQVAAMGAESGSVRIMVVSDLDNTMVDHQDGESKSLSAFGEMWGKEYSKDSLLVYSTGRSPTLFKELKASKPLRTPDVVICSVGTEILTGEEMVADKGWEELLDQGWDRAAILEEAGKFPLLRPQSDTEQRPHKLSYNLNKEDAAKVVGPLEENLKNRGLKAKVIYSGGCDLDILPQGAGKGRALEYFLKKLKGEGRYPKQTLVCGDSGNDVELFTVIEDGVYGVIVGNAMEELVSWYKEQPEESKSHVLHASERCAAGIMQALQHFGFKSA